MKQPIILRTHTYPSGNVLEIAESEDGRFDISHYDNSEDDDYDRWSFNTRAQCEEIYAIAKGNDDQVAFTAICVAAGGK